jgi:glutamine amidotransferase
MQLFCRSSEENGPNEGLGLFAAKVRRFPERPHLKVPHIGWNQLSFVGAHPVFAGLADGADAYFVHGYYVSCDHEEETIATTGHGVTFASATARDNLVGLQFHPEKSHRVGLRMLTNFLAL